MEILVLPMPIDVRSCDENGGCGGDHCWYEGLCKTICPELCLPLQ